MVQWNTNSSGNGIWACVNLGNGKDAMLSVYRCIVTNNYIQMVWIDAVAITTLMTDD